MDVNTSFAPPDLFSESFSPADRDHLSITFDAQTTGPWRTGGSGNIDPRVAPPYGHVQQAIGTQNTSHIQDGDGNHLKNDNPASTPVDLADEVKGMYRLLELIRESGSNGYFDKVIIAQDSLQRFINVMSPGAYSSITEVDFKALDCLAIKPLGIYGCKDEIVRLLQSLGAVDKKLAQLLLAPSDVSRTLSSGLYILKAGAIQSTDERHYIIYWPENLTWNDSASSSVGRNRVTFMRYLSKMCDQVISLLSSDVSASIVWSDEESDTKSADIDAGDFGRLFSFEVAKAYGQKENAISRPGFQLNFKIVVPHKVPPQCEVDRSMLVPRLVPGETAQGLLTGVYIPHSVRTATISQGSYSWVELSRLLKTNVLVLSQDIDDDTMQTLVGVALGDLFPEQCKNWRTRKQNVRDVFSRERTNSERDIAQNVAKSEDSLRHALREGVVDHVTSLFPSLNRCDLSSRTPVHGDAKVQIENSVRLPNIRAQYPKFESLFQEFLNDARFKVVSERSQKFNALKLDVISFWYLEKKQKTLHPTTRSIWAMALLFDHKVEFASQFLRDTQQNAGVPDIVTRFFSHWASYGENDNFKNQMKTAAANLPDSQFLQQLTDDIDFQHAIQNAKALAHEDLSHLIDTVVNNMTQAVLEMQQDHDTRTAQIEVDNEERKALNDTVVEFICEINTESGQSAGQRNSTVYLDHIGVEKEGHHITSFKVTGRWRAPQLSQIRIWVHPMDLTREDKDKMQLDTKYIPTPTINDRFSSFYLPPSAELCFCRLLENKKFLLILTNRDKLFVFLENLSALDMAIQRGEVIKTLSRDKLGLGRRIIFSFDEAKRVLAICEPTKLHLYVFMFDKNLTKIQGHGGVASLADGYSQAGITILQMTSVCGSEEVALVDSSARIRVFSFVTAKFRPSFIQLRTLPKAIYSSPDGSCLFVLHTHDSISSLTAYHWETFGSTGGIALDVPDFPHEGTVLTSMGSREHIFFLGLDSHSQVIKSVVFDIKKKVTKFGFNEKRSKYASNHGTRHTKHNSLLDCHAEIWASFPVLSAVRRRTIMSPSDRLQKGLTFIADHHTRPFASYFSDLITTFEKTTLKPTGDQLRGILVSAAKFGPFWDTVLSEANWKVSRYRVGEWLADLLCLIPINIAACPGNRFLPLVNGVLSAELEVSLLGAEVHQIADKLSFGWYESIFRSYLASKPVKVVSSMGQRSAWKRFSLNHIVDTSFSGNPMQTKEGVWMSVTPTDDALMVALDFEGLDGVERSPQEEALLVLFSTAISNLVLFNSNFASGRDISGLFQPFQSSTSMPEPSANPTLFQSALVIIIEDVMEADKIEITREVSRNLQRIVEQEHSANFISRLHGGKVDIMPWPMIESGQFYQLFETIKNRLDEQKVSHPTAGGFLLTIKTLMAKLMVNDWGKLSHTITEHRVQLLSALLPFALATGYSQIYPAIEPLKNFDTGIAVQWDDTAAQFTISNREQVQPAPNEIETCHSTLLLSRKSRTPRQFMPDSEWISGLESHLNRLIDSRVDHVQYWMDSNLERFESGHTAIVDIRRRFDSLVIEMKTNFQLCGAQCASCRLFCVRRRLHTSKHSCQTAHKCVRECEVCEGPTHRCGLLAGHPGKHVCVINPCGGPCQLLGRRGCLGDCTKVLRHGGDHLCSALVHLCEKPCALKDIKLPGGKTISCQYSCSTPSDQDHASHVCDAKLCPATCELCKRFCSRPHLHGLIPGARHLCGEAHPCPEPCAAPGICQINTSPKPKSILTDENKAYLNTRYNQVAKRMLCTQTIEPGLMTHEGGHTHSREAKPFHFCETLCPGCGYFCTLPFAHAQKEHETSHGSTSRPRWTQVINSPDDKNLELGGHKAYFSSERTPVMCNLVCSSMGRHVHIYDCRADMYGPCDDDAEVQHTNSRIAPDPDKPKDVITHSLYWRRTGFKDPYTHDEQANFSKCDAICPGPEHPATGNARPSYCILPMFHPPKSISDATDGLGYISDDGHMFLCKNPIGTHAC